MSKLFKLKEWLTIDEAAEHLTSVLGELIEEKDIYRLALDGYLQLSINIINGTQVHKGKLIKIDSDEWYDRHKELSTSFLDDEEKLNEFRELLKSVSFDGEHTFDIDEKVSSIDGVWDLPMFGGSRLDIEHYYQQLIGGPAVTLVNIDGAMVVKGNVICEVLESFDENEFKPGSLAQKRKMDSYIASHNLTDVEIRKIRDKFKKEREEFLEEQRSQTDEQNYYPSGGLPKEGVLVVRTQAIMDFLNSLNEGTEKSVSTKERQTLLVIIAALCKEANIDYTQRGIAGAIKHLTENLGSPITDDTIRNVFKQIEDAVESRSK